MKSPAFGLVVMLLVVIIALFVYWHEIYQSSPGWTWYINIEGGYTLLYPKDWALKECQDGEVVIGLSYIDKCLMPNQYNSNDMESLRVQVFVPKETYGLSSLYSVDSRKSCDPSWKTVIWERDGVVASQVTLGIKGYSPIITRQCPILLNELAASKRKPNYMMGINQVQQEEAQKYNVIIQSFKYIY
jgi:hypothetical protein